MEPATRTNALGALEMLSERLIDDLGDGQTVQVCLASDGLDPAAFDMEGSSLNVFQVQKNACLLTQYRLIRSGQGGAPWVPYL